MKRNGTFELLAKHGIRPSAQRLAIAEYVLDTTAHPSAERVFDEVSARLPMLSRATVYNTLHLLVEKRLLRQLPIAEGTAVFDPQLDPHHHFVDDATGEILDVPWEAIDVRRVEALRGFTVREYQVVLWGRSGPRCPAAGRASPRRRPTARAGRGRRTDTPGRPA